MAGIKISELEKLQEIQGNEEFPVAKKGNNYSVTSNIFLKNIKQENINLINYINKYVYDVSELFGKLAYRSGVKIDEKNIQGDGYFNKNGILVQVSGSGFVYQKSEVDPSKIYHIKQSNGIYSLVSILVLFDENDEIIQIIPYDYPTVGFDKYFIFKGVKSIGISFIKSQIDDPKFLRFESFDIQDLTTLINTSQGNRALYVAAGAVYNEQTGFYELNGLTDITEEEMKTIYLQTHVMDKLQSFRGVFAGTKFRTNLGFNRSLMQTNSRQFQFYDSFRENKSLEVLRISYGDTDVQRSMIVEHLGYAFYFCVKLRKIIGIIRLDKSSGVTSAFDHCLELQDVKLYGLLTNISFAYSPLISLESLQYLITNAANTSPITVTVHADVYAKIQDESNADWHSLLSAAQEKQITFATA